MMLWAWIAGLVTGFAGGVILAALWQRGRARATPD